MSRLFIGSAVCNVSSRGAVSLPQDFCITVQSRGAKHALYVAMHESSPCLIVFDRFGAEDRNHTINEGSRAADDLEYHNDLLRRSFGLASATRMDGRGRMQIALWMQTHPGRRHQMLAVGKGDHFEIWNLDYVFERGSDVLKLLARLHLHLQHHGEEDFIDAPALPVQIAQRCCHSDGEPGLRLQPLSPLPPRSGALPPLL